MSVHDGHRQRMKERFLAEGLENFNDLHVLELLLFYCVPRRDTNLLAHELLDRYGSLYRVLEAPPEELEKIPGVSKNVTTFFKLIPAAHRACEIGRAHEVPVVNTSKEATKVLRSFLMNVSVENVYMLCLDSKGKVLSVEHIAEGGFASANISIRKIIGRAIATGSTAIVLGHNHPGGSALPSDEDIDTTKYLAELLAAVNVKLMDHLVFSNVDFVSMFSTGLFKGSGGR